MGQTPSSAATVVESCSEPAWPDWLATWAGQACLRGDRIERSTERHLGMKLRLDRDTIGDLGHEHRGVLVTRCEGDGVLVGILRRFESCDAAERGFLWALMTDSKERAIVVKQQWLHSTTSDDKPQKVKTSEGARAWRSQRFVHGTVEAICRWRKKDGSQPVAALFLVDQAAHVHRARDGFRSGSFVVRHDRPQWIAELRQDLAQGLWSPPLVILTQQELRAVPVEEIQRAYCLNGFVFLDGRTLTVGR